MVEHQPSKLDTWVRFPSPAFFMPFLGHEVTAKLSGGRAAKAGEYTLLFYGLCYVLLGRKADILCYDKIENDRFINGCEFSVL